MTESPRKKKRKEKHLFTRWYKKLHITAIRRGRQINPTTKKKKKNKQTNKKLIVCCGRFWLLHNQDWALDVLYTMIAHTTKESSASPKNNVLVNKLNNMITT